MTEKHDADGDEKFKYLRFPEQDESFGEFCRHCVFRTMSKQEGKNLIKEALKEWLEEKYAQVGKWTIQGILAAVAAASLYFSGIIHNWWVK